MKKLPVRLRGIQELPEGREYLVMAPHSWERGGDLLKVVKRACERSAFPSITPARGTMIVYHVDPETFVDGMGYITYPKDSEPVELAKFDS